MQTLRTNLGRVRHVALQPQGRMLATVHGKRGPGCSGWQLQCKTREMVGW